MKVEIKDIFSSVYEIDEDDFISHYSGDFLDWMEGDEPELEDKVEFIMEILWENGNDTWGLPKERMSDKELEIDKW